MNGVDQRDHRETLMRQAGFRHAPDLSDIGPMVGIFDISRPGQLVAFLALFSATLAVSLPGNHGITAAFAADPPGRDYQIDSRHTIQYTFGMVFDPARMEQEAGSCG